jgi:LysR family transcriptional regulator, nod-box dependent transcriptional activator
MFHDFDLNLLVYLDSLLDLQSVSRAAVRSHITQSAMSLALARLRKVFSDELLVPSAGRKMVLTPLAESLRLPLREAIMKIDAVKNTSAHFNPAESKRKFTIDASGEAVEVLLHALAGPLFQQAPGVQLVLNLLDIEVSLGAKHDLIIAPQKLFGHDVYTESLWKDAWTCVMWSGNNVVGEELTLQQYSEMGYAFSNVDHHYGDPGHIVRRMEVYVPELSMIPSAIIGTNRVAVLGARLARILAARSPLRLLPPPVHTPEIVEYMQWHHLQDADPGAAWFRDLVKQAFNKETAL